MTLQHCVYFFYLSVTHTRTHNISGKVDETRESTRTPTPKLNAAVSVSEQVINPSLISDITEVGRLDNTECLFFLFFFVKHIKKQILQGKGDETT